MAASSTYSLPRCPVEVTLSLISSRWVVLILRELIYGTRRFGQIRKALGGVSTRYSHRTCEPWRRTDCSPARPLPKCLRA